MEMHFGNKNLPKKATNKTSFGILGHYLVVCNNIKVQSLSSRAIWDSHNLHVFVTQSSSMTELFVLTLNN